MKGKYEIMFFEELSQFIEQMCSAPCLIAEEENSCNNCDLREKFFELALKRLQEK